MSSSTRGHLPERRNIDNALGGSAWLRSIVVAVQSHHAKFGTLAVKSDVLREAAAVLPSCPGEKCTYPLCQLSRLLLEVADAADGK